MRYDVVIVGGGLAGSSLGAALVREGGRVLILEREPAFRDRLRGEAMMPWGVAEARTLGLLDALLAGCASSIRWFTTPDNNRDIPATTPAGLGFLTFYHPAMQQCLLDYAVLLGCELHRPAEVVGVVPGETPAVLFRENGREQWVEARLVVGADGRNSRVRGWAGFTQAQDSECIVIAGTLYRGMSAPRDAIELVVNPLNQRLLIVIPIGGGRFRVYAGFRRDAHPMLSGAKDQDAFVQVSIETGASAAWFDGAEPDGPLASFAAPDGWVRQPYRDGIVLVGDAAASSDPVFGCGLSLTLRSVRRLRDELVTSQTRDDAGLSYALAQNKDAMALHDALALVRGVFFDVGPEADARRSWVLPLVAQGRAFLPDFVGLGPDAPHVAAEQAGFMAEP
jgi:2-polyprenyl-6-methoxyphenol hydroxylase-like FAD-dependent oxidoreductase